MKTQSSSRFFGIVILFFLSTVHNLLAQPQMTWSQVYGGQRVDRFQELIQLPGGGYVTGGSTKSFGMGSVDFYLVRTQANGDVIWQFTYGLDGDGQLESNDDEICLDMIQTNDGGYALAGWTESEGAGAWDFWLLKTDANGENLWSRTYGGDRSELCYSVQQNYHGGYSLAGYSRTFGPAEQNAWLVKTDNEGAVQWTQDYGGGDIATAEFWSHVQTSDGGFALCGQLREINRGQDGFLSDQIYVVKTDGEGNEIWSRTFGGSEVDIGTDIVETEDGGFAIAGSWRELDGGFLDHDYCLIKVDTDGNLLWSRTYGHDGRWSDEVCYGLQQCADGGFILTGKADTPSGEEAHHYDLWLVRTDENGELRWSQNYGGDFNDDACSVILTQDGGYASVGSSQPFRGGRENAYLIKVEPDALNGQFAWAALPDTGFAEDRALGLELAFLREHIESLDDDYAITVEDGEHVFGEIIDDRLVVSASADWWGSDSLKLTVSNLYNRSALTTLHVEVTPINDPPGKFVLTLPEDNYEAVSRQLIFEWNISEPTKFEDEEIRYRIRFAVGDEEYEVADIDVNSYTVLDIYDLLIDLGFGEIEDDLHIVWAVTAYDDNAAETECNQQFNLFIPALSVSDNMENQPLTFALDSPSPNPFNAMTSLTYSLDRVADISLRIYDHSGRIVAMLFEGSRNPGLYSTTWNASGIPTGVYYARLEDNFGRMESRELVLVK